MSAALDLALIVTGLSYVSFAPFTKIEESFNLHATHDVLMYGVGAANLPEVRDASLVHLGARAACFLYPLSVRHRAISLDGLTVSSRAH